MLHISYDKLCALIDGIDAFIGGCYTRKKHKALLGNDIHFRRLRTEYETNPSKAIIVIIALRYQEHDIVIDITRNVKARINSATAFESIFSLIKSSNYIKYKPLKKVKL